MTISPFKHGDRVKMLDVNTIVYGTVTVVTDTTCKVLFEGDWAPDYWYYKNEDLTVISEKEFQKGING